MANLGSTIISTLSSGLSMIPTLAGGVKDGIVHFFTDGTTVDGVYTASGLSVAGQIALTFGGIALAFGICKLCYHVFRSKMG